MTGELTASWGATIAKLRGDRSVRCIVVTGEGSAFCAGGDLSWIAESPDLNVDAIRDRMLPFYRTWLSIRELETPSIAAVNGHAVGAGLCLALACDLRYAARGAKLSAPFTQLGMPAGRAAPYRLTEAVGQAAARELLLTGRAVACHLRATSRSGGGFVSHNVGSRYGSVNGARAAAVDGGGDELGTVRSVVVDARRTPLWMGDGDDRRCAC